MIKEKIRASIAKLLGTSQEKITFIYNGNRVIVEKVFLTKEVKSEVDWIIEEIKDPIKVTVTLIDKKNNFVSKVKYSIVTRSYEELVLLLEREIADYINHN